MKIDLRFVDPGYEMMILVEYLKLVETETPEIIARGRERISQTVHDGDQDVNRSIIAHLDDRLERGILTRFLPASVVMATWAIYEAAVIEVSEWLRKQANGLPTTDKHLKLKGGFVSRRREYYEKHLHSPMHPEGTDWARLDRLARLRNLLAHANGSLRHVRDKGDREQLRAWIGATAGLAIEDGYILVSPMFARDSLDFIRGLVRELVERVRATFPVAR